MSVKELWLVSHLFFTFSKKFRKKKVNEFWLVFHLFYLYLLFSILIHYSRHVLSLSSFLPETTLLMSLQVSFSHGSAILDVTSGGNMTVSVLHSSNDFVTLPSSNYRMLVWTGIVALSQNSIYALFWYFSILHQYYITIFFFDKWR